MRHTLPRKKTAQDVITLGKTGIKVSRLAQGTGTNGVGKASNQTRGLGEQGLAELGTDHIDIVLLHCMLDANWSKQKAGAMHALSEAKQKGIIRIPAASTRG